jgi:hypothetical protein
MRANPFEGQLERLARTLTEQFGVTVLCQGDCACTDGRRILLLTCSPGVDPVLMRVFTAQELGREARDEEDAA